MISNRNDKLSAVSAVLQSTAVSLSAISKTIPNTSKFNRNIFKKKYNRRPGNKKKVVTAVSLMAVTAGIGAAEIARIRSQPIPRYAPGSLTDEQLLTGQNFKFILIDSEGNTTPMPPPIK